MNARRPNILWISTHDISPHLGAYAGMWPGAERARTPHLDQLAAEGVVFEKAFAAAPVCSPSRSAIMTGRYPISIGTMHMRTKAVPPPEVHLLPEHLRAAGYYATNNVFTDYQVQVPGTAYDDCSDSAHWRNRPTQDTPFFAAFHGMATHESSLYLPDEKYGALTAALPADLRRDPDEEELPPYYPATPAFRKAWARYHELISLMDLWVGDLLQQLEDDGLADDTMVVFWSDHGIGMPRAKRYSYEAGLHEPLIVRWPGRLPAGGVRSDVVELMDLMPTTLRVAGIAVPDHVEAEPLIDSDGSLLARSTPYAFGSRDRMGDQFDAARTARDDRYRYILNLHPDRPYMLHNEYMSVTSTWQDLRRILSQESSIRARGEEPHLLAPEQRVFTRPDKPVEELYDLAADPFEVVNLADDPDHAAVLLRMRSAVAQWRERTGDLGAIPEHELLERWRPGGRWQVAAAPAAAISDGHLTASSETDGAVIGWTYGEPRSHTDADDGGMGAEIGHPEPDDRVWTILDAPTPVDAAQPIVVKAWRLGFRPSVEVRPTSLDNLAHLGTI